MIYAPYIVARMRHFCTRDVTSGRCADERQRDSNMLRCEIIVEFAAGKITFSGLLGNFYLSDLLKRIQLLRNYERKL